MASLLVERQLDPAAVLSALLARSGASAGFVFEREGGAVVGVGPRKAVRAFGPGWKDLKKEAAAGAFGLVHYEAVRHLERLPLPAGEDGVVYLFDELIEFSESGAQLVSRDGTRRPFRLDGVEPLSAPQPAAKPLPLPAGRLGRAGFLAGVRALKKNIRAGDIFQAVLSDRFELPFSADPFALYATLRAAGPTPYRFLLKDGDRVVLGSSPERLVKVEGELALNNPIAGTRPRGKTPAEDAKLERQLTRSPKERAEHLMLVDLGRNDLGRVCAPGSVRVRELMKVRKFSNVMHLVSEVEGRLDAGTSPWDVLAASFPAGTVSGAPKVRAMELIAGLEKAPRGFYSGAAVFTDFSGNLDAALTIRSAEVSNGKIKIQAGAGIVADSRPEAEWLEVQNKLLALRKALSDLSSR